MNTRTIVDPKRALDAAIEAELDAVRREGHDWCHQSLATQHHLITQQPGTVPPGATRAICQLVNRRGFRVKTATPEQVARASQCPLNTVGAVTVGWLPPGTERLGIAPFSVMIDRTASPLYKFGNLCHEAGHVLLGHTPANRWEAEAMQHGHRDGPREDEDEETACELGRAALLHTIGLPTKASRHYLAHREVSGKGIDGARTLTRLLWPAIAPALN